MAFRTLWILIRGRNYATEATRDATKELTKLEKQQEKVARQTRYMMFTGLLMVATAGIMGAALAKLATKTALGAGMADDFSKAWENLTTGVGEAIMKSWGPAIESFIKDLDDLGDNETFQMIIGEAAVPVTLGLSVVGISMVLSSGLASIINYVAAAFGSSVTVSGTSLFIPVTAILSMALIITFQEELAEIWGKFTDPINEALDEWLKESSKKQKEKIAEGKEKGDWVSIAWDAIMEWFFPTGTYGSWSGKQMGTRYIPETGPYMLHQGEAVVPTAGSIGNIGAGMASGGNYFDVKISVSTGDIHTEADERRLAKHISEKFAKDIIDRLG